jgi:hypothetical protein
MVFLIVVIRQQNPKRKVITSYESYLIGAIPFLSLSLIFDSSIVCYFSCAAHSTSATATMTTITMRQILSSPGVPAACAINRTHWLMAHRVSRDWRWRRNRVRWRGRIVRFLWVTLWRERWNTVGERRLCQFSHYSDKNSRWSFTLLCYLRKIRLRERERERESGGSARPIGILYLSAFFAIVVSIVCFLGRASK